MTEIFDRRLHPVRADLAASGYRGRVSGRRFAEGTAMQVVADKVALRPAADLARPIDSEALHGERVTVYEDTGDGWCWGQLETDGYVGFLPSAALTPAGAPPTHRVAVLRSYRYPVADLKLPPLGVLSFGARVEVVGRTVTRGLAYALLADGSAMVERHLVTLDHRAEDWVGQAELFLGTPYLWGGRSSLGLDCSALVQLPALAAGYDCPRDSDMQEAGFGTALDISEGLPELRRGDLVFWKGHVAIMAAPDTLLHANGYTMTVACEPLEAAVERIARTEWGEVTACRRVGG